MIHLTFYLFWGNISSWWKGINLWLACLPAGVLESQLTLFSSIFIAHISDDSIPDMYWLIESSILLNVIMTALLLPTSQRGEITLVWWFQFLCTIVISLLPVVSNQGCLKVWKYGGRVVIGGYNMPPSPGWDRVIDLPKTAFLLLTSLLYQLLHSGQVGIVQ